MENDNDENVGGEDTKMQLQPSYPDFSIYFMTFMCLCFVKSCVLL